MPAPDCPCPLERKVLIQTLNSIVQVLGDDTKERAACQAKCEAECVAAKRCGGETALSRVPSGQAGTPTTTSCSAAKPCGAATSLPRVAAAAAAASPCEETALVPYEPGAPLKACKSSELRAGAFLPECRCLKRDGLQRACRRTGCGDRCGFVRPAVRDPVPLGSAVPGYSLRPVCCPGKKQAARLEYLHDKAEMLKRPPPLPPLEPLPQPPPPPYNWRGTFEHKCRPDRRCPRRPAPLRYPCGGAKCKHWEVPQPCTLPVCRADCFEQPPGWPDFCR